MFNIYTDIYAHMFNMLNLTCLTSDYITLQICLTLHVKQVL